jgi:hypothetical protein
MKFKKGEKWIKMPKNKNLKILDLVFVNDADYQSEIITPIFDSISDRFSL